MIRKKTQHEIEMERYVRKNPPYKSGQGLGVNVGGIMRYAQEKGISVDSLKEWEIEPFVYQS